MMNHRTEFQSNNVDLQNIVNYAGTKIDEQTDLIKRIKIELGLMALNNLSWSEISEIAESGNAANYWAVGDTKKVVLNGTVGTLELSNYETYVYIIGFDHNGATNTIDFGTFKTAASGGVDVALVDAKYDSLSTSGTLSFNVNHWGWTGYGGWAGCDLRYDILGSTDVAPSGYGSAPVSGRVGYDASSTCATNPVANTLMAALPSELRNVMKPMTIYTDNVGDGTNVETNVTTTIDYLPLLAEFEIFGIRTQANNYEQSYQAQYTYYANGNSKVKYLHSNILSTVNWLERSPIYANTAYHCIVDYNGNTNGNDVDKSSSIAPIFRV